MTITKASLRKQLLQQRRSLDPELWRNYSDRICSNLQNSSIFQQAETILGYFSINQEPDLSPLFTQKTWGFPRCLGDSLHWYYWQPTEVLIEGSYGIPEPSLDASRVSPDQVDLILVPAVACDAQGYRLGYGGGFYDRLFQQTQWSKITAIAIVFDFAYLPSLPRDSWDKQLQGICTESRVYLQTRL